MIALLLDSGRISDFENLIKIYNNPNFIVKLMLIFTKEIDSHKEVLF
jgi:hypothetical protein